MPKDHAEHVERNLGGRLETFMGRGSACKQALSADSLASERFAPLIAQRTFCLVGSALLALLVIAALAIEFSARNVTCAQAKPLDGETTGYAAAIGRAAETSSAVTESAELVVEKADAITALALDRCADVPALIQYPDMPAGCEVYSLTAVLQAYGHDADPYAIADEHLPFESEDGTAAGAYSGSPYGNGEGLPPAIVAAGNSYLEDTGSSLRFSDATGTPFDELLTRAGAGSPVLIWTTMYLTDPGFGAPLPSYSFYPLEHCVVLLGSDGDTVRYMDPMSGYAEADSAWFGTLYELCGSMAAIIG